MAFGIGRTVVEMRGESEDKLYKGSKSGNCSLMLRGIIYKLFANNMGGRINSEWFTRFSQDIVKDMTKTENV